MNNPLKFTDPSGYQIRKSEADAWAEAMTDRNDFFMINSGGGSGVGTGASTPHIYRMRQESIAQDPYRGWRIDSDTGEPYNLFTYENGWVALGNHVNLPKNIDHSSVFFGSRKGVRGVWYQSGDLVGNYLGWRDGIDSPNLQLVVKNTFITFDALGKLFGNNEYINSIEDVFWGATESRIGSILKDRGIYGKLNPETIVRTPFVNIHLSTNALKITGTAMKWGGRAFGAISLGATFVKWNSGEIGGIEATLDTTFGLIGFAPGYGWAISGAYFLIAKPIYNYAIKP